VEFGKKHGGRALLQKLKEAGVSRMISRFNRPSVV
jgi:hypothetical protein